MVITRKVACRTCTAILPMLIVVFMAGCGFNTPPRIQVEKVSLVEATADRGLLELELHLENPNTDPLELERFSYHVNINGKRQFRGEWAALRTLPSNGYAVIPIPAVIPISTFGDTLPEPGSTVEMDLSWGISGSLRYREPGFIADLLFDTGMRTPSVGFSGRGTMSEVAVTRLAESPE